jgi:hypothetical protein
MRDEVLKRLDELVAEVNRLRADPFRFGLLGWDERWAALRAELVAERCENCAHWSSRTVLGGTHPGLAECVVHENDMHDDDYCSHFTKKEMP